MRTLVRWDPFSEMTGLRPAMVRVFEEFAGRGEPQDMGFPIDLSEAEDKVIVKATLPGIDAKDVDISVSEGVLTIKGETRSEENEAGKHYYRQEIRYGAFSRSIPLPTRVNHEQAEATFENGILTVTLPKAEDILPKQIKVTATRELKATSPSKN